jgi:plasmid maintenance system antidote protein VapI
MAFNTLHYGGSLTKKNHLSTKPDPKTLFREQRRFETMIRLEGAGITDRAAAAMLGVSVRRLEHLKKTPEYLTARMRITYGIILDNSSQLAMLREQRKEMLTQLLPQAFQVLANELQAKATTIAERKHQVDVARDIMDREGSFAKVSRAEIKPVDSFDFEHADEASRSIINTIRSIASPVAAVHSAASVETSEKFSNSHTLSQVDQQKALDALEEAAASGKYEEEYLATLPTDGTVN